MIGVDLCWFFIFALVWFGMPVIFRAYFSIPLVPPVFALVVFV